MDAAKLAIIRGGEAGEWYSDPTLRMLFSLPGVTLQRFTLSEWRLLEVLVEFYPYYAPYAHLLAAVTSQPVCVCQSLLASEENTQFALLLTPVRLGIRSLRLSKLSAFRMTCIPVRRQGYILSHQVVREASYA